MNGLSIIARRSKPAERNAYLALTPLLFDQRKDGLFRSAFNRLNCIALSASSTRLSCKYPVPVQGEVTELNLITCSNDIALKHAQSVINNREIRKTSVSTI